MSEISIEQSIVAPVEVVWAKLSDIGSHVSWMTDAEKITFHSDQMSGVGTTFSCLTKVGPLKLNDEMAVTEWQAPLGDSPGVIAVDHDGLVSGVGEFKLSAGGKNESVLAWTEQLSFPWRLGGRLTEKAARPVLMAIWKKNLKRFAELVEGG